MVLVVFLVIYVDQVKNAATAFIQSAIIFSELITIPTFKALYIT